jgi:2,4-dienoyl-CoA reductase-like NADH-dependent reductase (Old Yellow Enzyme family)
MFTPFTLRGVTLKNRVVVSPMAQYSASTACPATSTWCTWARARWAAPAW